MSSIISKLVIATEATPSASLEATSSAVIDTNATAGKATIPAGVSEITINNPSVGDNTLIYVTPTSSSQNNVLFVKSKQTGKFTVGFTNPIDVDVKFNWPARHASRRRCGQVGNTSSIISLTTISSKVILFVK